MLHKAPDCDPEAKNKKQKITKTQKHTQKIPTITCSKYVLSLFHENSLSHNFAKRRMETTYKKSCDHF